MQGKTRKDGARPARYHISCICVVRLLFVLFYVLFVCKCVLPPGDNPIAVNKYIISYIIYIYICIYMDVVRRFGIAVKSSVHHSKSLSLINLMEAH